MFAGLSHPSAVSLGIGLPLSMLGLALRAWAAGHLAKDRKLGTSGPYAYIRNPLYVGTLMAALGLVIAARSFSLFLVYLVVFLLIYLPTIELEEQHLREIFPDYPDYAAAVRRFIPRSRYLLERRPFSGALYRRNEEYKAIVGFILAVVWLIYRLL